MYTRLKLMYLLEKKSKLITMLPSRVVCSYSVRLFSKFHTLSKTAKAGYKSQYNVEFVYPQSDKNSLRVPEVKHTYTTSSTDEEFTGYIPLGELDIKYVKGGGPGGQHVNKVNTKVEMKFHIDNATWIPDWIKSKLKENEHGRINKQGYLLVSSDRTRTQLLNQADCLDRIRTMVFNAAKKPAEPSEEDLKKIAKRIAKANSERLRQKREISMKKRNRRTLD